MSIRSATSANMPRSPLLVALGLGLGQVALLSILYKHILDFDCSDNGIEGFCNFFSSFVTSALCLSAFLALFALIRRSELQTLLSETGPRLWPLLINSTGFVLLLMPLFLLSEGLQGSTVRVVGAFWSAGSILAAVGLVLLAAPIHVWRGFLERNGAVFLPLVALGALTPLLSSLLRPIWNLESITTQTFNAVVLVTDWLGYVVESYPEERILGAGDFYLLVSELCSGIEGVALVTMFVTVYLVILRDQLRFPRVLILLPIAILASITLNIARIVLLLIIGLEGNPELAVGGFHSHAGWLMFTLIGLGIVVASHNMPVFQASTAQHGTLSTPLPPFFQDPTVAKILPFAGLMASAMLASTFTQNPSEAYPYRMALVLLVLLPFLPLYKRIEWRVTALALLVGVAIAALWIVVPFDAETDAQAPFGALTGAALIGWLIARGIGTSVIIPLVEELFFRDYLMNRLSFFRGQIATAVSLVLSSVLFAALHGRSMEALIAGAAFGLLYLHQRKIADAIVAHAVANALIFAYALWTWNFHII